MPFHPDPDAPLEQVATRDGYDRWSQLYDDEFNPLVVLEQPLVRARVGDPAGRRMLDVGTGTGRHAAWFAGQGADVTAIDFSTGMLARAAGKPGWERVTPIEHDLRTPWPLADDTFEIVLSALVLDHIVDLPHFFRECRRVAQPGGTVLCSVVHPAMLLRGLKARFTDPETGEKISPQATESEMADYLNAAISAGLTLHRVDEYPVDRALADQHARAARYLDWPLLLLMEWRRP